MLEVSRETSARLQEFVRILRIWNTKINLIGRRSEGEWWTRHIEDSLQLAPLLPADAQPIADLGSGGGFPGLVLAIVRPQPIHLVEADKRKSAFLREVISALCLDHAVVHTCRIEEASLPPMAAITARALAPLDTLLQYSSRILGPDGVGVFPKGRTAEAELTAAFRRWQMTVERFVSVTDGGATIFRIRDIRPA